MTKIKSNKGNNNRAIKHIIISIVPWVIKTRHQTLFHIFTTY